MGKIIEAVYALLYAVILTSGGSYAVQKVGVEIKKAALTKAAQGLPPLLRFQANNN